LILLLLLLAMVLHISPTGESVAGTCIIRVPNDFPTIQQAINAAQSGSIVLVNSGVYHENLLINKTLTMLGIDQQNTVIEGSVNITEADNVVLNGFTMRNSSFCGIDLYHSNCSVISGNVVTLNPFEGIGLDYSCNNTISGNIVLSNRFDFGAGGLVGGDGIGLSSSSNNTLSNNIIRDSVIGLDFGGIDNNNIVFGNVFSMNERPLILSGSNNATFFNNNFMDPLDSYNFSSSTNSWSFGGRGNYWNDYTGLDDGSGGRVAGDGLGDTDLPWHGGDYYPLISPANPLLVFWNNQAFAASIVSNSTISAFTFDQPDKKIAFDVTGSANSTGYVNMSIPMRLLSGAWTILVDGADAASKTTIAENQTYTTIYLNYSQSTHSVQVIGTKVIPEFPTASPFLLLILLAMPPTISIVKKRKKNKT